jgi:hypothetical protein
MIVNSVFVEIGVDDEKSSIVSGFHGNFVRSMVNIKDWN